MPKLTKEQQEKLNRARGRLTKLYHTLHATIDLHQTEIPEVTLTALAQLGAILDYSCSIDRYANVEALRQIYQQVKQLRLPHDLGEAARALKSKIEGSLSIYTISTNATHSPQQHLRPPNTDLIYLSLLKQKIAQGDALALLRFIAEYAVSHVAERLALASTPLTPQQVLNLYQKIINTLIKNDSNTTYADAFLLDSDGENTTNYLKIILTTLSTDLITKDSANLTIISILQNDHDILPGCIEAELESSPRLIAESFTYIRGKPNTHAKAAEVPVELLRAATHHLATTGDETLLTALARGQRSALPAPPRYPLSLLKDPTSLAKPVGSTAAITEKLTTTPKTGTNESDTATSSTTAGSSSGSASTTPEIPPAPEKAQAHWPNDDPEQPTPNTPTATKTPPKAKSALTAALKAPDPKKQALLFPRPHVGSKKPVPVKEKPTATHGSLHITGVPDLAHDEATQTIRLKNKLHDLADGVIGRETLALQMLCCEIVFNTLIRNPQPESTSYHHTVVHYALHIIFGISNNSGYTPISVATSSTTKESTTDFANRIVSQTIARLHKTTAGEYSTAPLLKKTADTINDVDAPATQLAITEKLTTALCMTDPTELAKHLCGTLTMYEGRIITAEERKTLIDDDIETEGDLFTLDM